MSLDAEQMQPPSGRRAGACATAAIAVPAGAAQTLSETGSSVMAPLFALWGPAGHTRYSQATLRTASSSPGAGISSAAAGTADIGAVNGAGSQAYPIINDEYAVVRTSQASTDRAQDLRAFLSWAITSGTARLARVNFQPPSIVTLSTAQIAKTKG